jgi:thioredoxin reductase (NADPH)
VGEKGRRNPRGRLGQPFYRRSFWFGEFELTIFQHRKVVIIGSGPAGYTAAIYAARAALDPLLIQGIQPGGQLMITTDVENWPGDVRVSGPDLMARMEQHAQHAGASLLCDNVEAVNLAKRPFQVTCENDAIITADTLIIATGASARWLGLESEERYRTGGVSACATCDGSFYRDQHVAVVGGGNTAAEEALYLSNIAAKVHLIHRRNTLRADRTNQARIMANSKIEVIWEAEVAEILGDGRLVNALAVRSTISGVVSQIAVAGVFVAIGHDPATGLFKGQLAMDSAGYLVVEPGTAKTSVPGVYAAGDVQDRHFRQAITSAGMGCMAALEAERFLAQQGSVP